jgi:AGZA family xanthine/uracil permease-like MFS transporter
LTTFLTMAYIVVVNPILLGAAGVPVDGAILATCIASAFATLLMGLLADYPIALAPGMGLNAFFAYGICIGAGVPWQTALGLVFWAGVLFLLLTVTGARRMIVDAIPESIKLSGAAGIGLFIAFIGLKQGGLIRADENTLVAMAPPDTPAALLTLAGLLVTLVLVAAKVRTAIFWGLVVTVALGLAVGWIARPEAWVAMPSLDLPGLRIDLLGALRLEYVPLLLVLLFFDLFDTMGTLIAIAHEGGFLKDGKMPRIDRAMSADAVATVAGSLCGTSPVTSYIESATGIAVGARTGLANVFTALLFLGGLFLTPLVRVIGEGVGEGTNPVTAAALIIVGTLMVRVVRRIDWGEMTEATPAFFTLLLMPVTYSISHGLAAGIICYAVVKTAAGRAREVHWLMYALAAIFVLRYALLPV